MEFTKLKDGTVKLEGDLNIYVAKELKEKLQEVFNKNKKIRIDLSEITDIDTSCIQILLSLKILAKNNKIDYKLVNPSPVVKEAFKLSGILKK